MSKEVLSQMILSSHRFLRSDANVDNKQHRWFFVFSAYVVVNLSSSYDKL